METIEERERRNDPELAQWYLESGSDDKWWALIPLCAGIVGWPLAPILIPFAIYLFVSGCRKRGKGKRMNAAAGREDFERCPNTPNRFIPHAPMRNERYGSVSDRPPGHPDYYEIPSGGTAPIPAEYASAPSTAEANAGEKVYHRDYYEVSVHSS